jgi:copper transport protein
VVDPYPAVVTRVALVLALLALLAPASAGAHASFVRSEPRDGSVLTDPPSSVRLHFDDAVQPVDADAIRNGGASVLAGELRRDGARALVVPLRRALPDGDYTVRWRAVSDDGHLIQGVLAFGVGEGRPPPRATLTVGGNGPGVVQIVSRWLFLAGVLLVFGASVFEAAVARGGSRRTSVLLALGFAFGTVGSFGLVPHAGGDPTRAERVYEAGALIAMTGLAAAAIALVERWVRYVAWAAAAAMLPVPTLAGHALDGGQPRLLNAVADVVHLGAAAVWVGGVVALALTLLAGGARPVLRRFSTVALVAVGVLGGTGVVRAFGELSAVDQLWSTGYGRALVVKTILLLVLVAIGYVNRVRFVPRNALGALRVTTGVETALLAAVVVAVAFLTALPPGRAVARQAAEPAGPPPPPPAGALVLAQAAGSDGLAVALTPREVQVTVLGADNNGVDAAPVRVNGREATERCGPGCYSAPLAGRPKRLEVSLRGERPLSFPLPRAWPAPSGQAIADRAYRTYRASGSVTIDERLASGPDRTLRTRFRAEAPNRLAYDIAGGPQAVGIGSRRWDRPGPKAPWQRTDASPSTQPTVAWRRATNAHMLGPNRVTFYDPTIPAWFDVRVDPRTGRPVTLRMTAAAHFMRHVYRSYGSPREIFPPRARR